MFNFLGLFADAQQGVIEQMRTAWPSLRVSRIEKPFNALALRLEPHDYDYVPKDEDIPISVIERVVAISSLTPSARYLILSTECFGGFCGNCGVIIENGVIKATADGEGALRTLVKHFGVDLGPTEFFEPLRRDFPWET
jgi:hypothetical protein